MNNPRNVAQVAPYLQPGQPLYQRGPIVKPIDSCWRGFYETGKDGNFNNPTLPAVAFEAQAFISKQPCWLTLLHAAFTVVDQDLYVLLYDLNPADPAQLALLVANAPARWTLGPVPALTAGTIIYEASAELIPLPFQGSPQGGPEKPWAYGVPFNFGIVAVPSSTPRVWSQPIVPECVAITARVQT